MEFFHVLSTSQHQHISTLRHPPFAQPQTRLCPNQRLWKGPGGRLLKVTYLHPICYTMVSWMRCSIGHWQPLLRENERCLTFRIWTSKIPQLTASHPCLWMALTQLFLKSFQSTSQQLLTFLAHLHVESLLWIRPGSFLDWNFKLHMCSPWTEESMQPCWPTKVIILPHLGPFSRQ